MNILDIYQFNSNGFYQSKTMDNALSLLLYLRGLIENDYLNLGQIFINKNDRLKLLQLSTQITL